MKKKKKKKHTHLLEDNKMFLCLRSRHLSWSLSALGRRWDQMQQQYYRREVRVPNCLDRINYVSKISSIKKIDNEE